MKLYNSIGPNPRMVRMFMHEKGIEIPLEAVDLMGGENRRAPYTDKNPAGQLPALALDDGTVIAEITAICEYLEDIQPEPHLIGGTPQERAETRMWTRRVDLNIVEPMTSTSWSRWPTASATAKARPSSRTGSTSSPRPPTI
jgi:glutathione S-transferase